MGGRIPRSLIPAVDKGVQETMKDGIIAGYPLTGIRVAVYDGSYHSVDSNEMAFRAAARHRPAQGMAPMPIQWCWSLSRKSR